MDGTECAVLRQLVRSSVLSIAMYGALAEDMRRRGVYDAGKAAAFCALPVVGPCVLLARPKLED